MRAADTWTEVATTDELEALVGTPLPAARDKVGDRLLPDHRAWLAASPLCLVATADAEGRCDASPKGDPAGTLTHVVDDRTLAIAERPGNRRVDGYRNVLANPQVGLCFLIPGRGDTLRVNGRARLVSEAPFLDLMVVRGHRPVLALVVEVEEVFFHCSKAFLRSQVWEPGSWNPDVVDRRAALVQRTEDPSRSLADLDAHYGPSYAERLYG